MKSYRIITLLVVLLFLFTSCGDQEVCCFIPPVEETPVEETPLDPRLEFIGIYDCDKSTNSDFQFSQQIEVFVQLDSLNEENISINGILVPIDSTGVFGPDFINNLSTNYFVEFKGDSIRIENFGSIPNGIVAPCFIRGVRR